MAGQVSFDHRIATYETLLYSVTLIEKFCVGINGTNYIITLFITVAEV